MLASYFTKCIGDCWSLISKTLSLLPIQPLMCPDQTWMYITKRPTKYIQPYENVAGAYCKTICKFPSASRRQIYGTWLCTMNSWPLKNHQWQYQHRQHHTWPDCALKEIIGLTEVDFLFCCVEDATYKFLECCDEVRECCFSVPKELWENIYLLLQRLISIIFSKVSSMLNSPCRRACSLM